MGRPYLVLPLLLTLALMAAGVALYGLLLQLFHRDLAGLQCGVFIQWQHDRFAGFGRFVNAQDDLDRAAPFWTIDGRITILLDRLDHVFELFGVPMMADGAGIARAAAVVSVTMTSTLRRTSSLARSGSRSIFS